MVNFLLVDDDREVITILHKMIETIDSTFNIAHARNGAKALNELEKGKIDFLITDLKMDVVNGIDLIKNINRITQAPPIIVVCSGHRDLLSNEITDSIDGYLGKPPKPDEVRELVTTLLEKRKPIAKAAKSSGLFSRFFGQQKKSG